MLSVGAAVTFSEILTSETVETNAGLLKLAVARVASPQIRNLATLGGNVVNASPAADGLTAMICLDAQAELAAWQNGGIVVRRMAVSDLVTGPGRTCRRENEFVVRFLVPSAAGIRCIYEKVGLRSAMAIAVLSLAMVADCRPPQPRIRIALGSLGPKTVVVHEAEKLAESGDIEGSVSLYMKAIRPIDDIRATANYRRTAVKNILLRQIRSVLEESKHESAGEICTKR